MPGPLQKDKSHVVLLLGTQKGLFRLHADRARRHWHFDGPHIPGYEILHAWLDPRAHPIGYAVASHPTWGSHIYQSRDAGRTWQSLSAVPCHRPGEYPSSVNAIWYLAPGHREAPACLYAGIDPPGLFVSQDQGQSWAPIEGLNHHPTRGTWEPARGGFAVHSIHVDPSNGKRLYAAVSAGGAFRSDDGGESWKAINRGVRAENLPAQSPETGHNIHRLIMHPARSSRLYRQCYNGTYLSDDRGETWDEITEGLPSDFGYAIVSDPNDPDSLYVVPEESAHMRTTVDRKLRVYRSADAGKKWEALTQGLPQDNVYVTVLREAMATDGLEPCGVYFGTSGGHLFVSADAGDHWELTANFLPRILSISATVLQEE